MSDSPNTGDLWRKSRGRETPQAKAEPSEVMKRLAAAIREARKMRHMTVLQMAHDIGISESALRRIENLTSHNTRGETYLLIMVWAGRRGYREFAGFSISPDAHKSALAITLRRQEIQEASHG
jgi:transcriptional regulator with XRE-family HTH domain